MINRDTFPPILFWRSDSGRIAQRFYISFCLLMSSIQDTFLGLLQREQNNLNWSATCSYYGLVHAGRLLTFISAGDFPTAHSDLRKLLTLPNPRRDGRFRLDWMKDFIQEATWYQDYPGTPRHSHSELYELISSYLLACHIDEAETRFRHFSSILNTAAPLRNDSNYEALLIAHEHDHDTVTPCFRQLAGAMSSGALWSIRFAGQVFRRYVEEDHELADRRETYRSFVNAYLERRLLQPVEKKVQTVPRLVDELRAVVSEIRPQHSDADFEEIEHQVSYTIFGLKAKLMRNFEHKTDELDRTVREGT
jgi:hypothetical protein